MEKIVRIEDWARAEVIQKMIASVHAEIREVTPDVVRVAFALYDEATDTLKTFVYSSDTPTALPHYAAKLSDVPSLAALVKDRRCRTISDMPALPMISIHTRQLVNAGYRSSYTLPIFKGDSFLGFLFFNSLLPNYFDVRRRQHLAVFAQLITVSILYALAPLDTLKSAVSLVASLGRLRDDETGAHLERMSRYAWIVAQQIAIERSISDEFVELIQLFSPLHDIGKIGIPDAILLKPGPLDREEMEIMKRHPELGAQIIQRISGTFHLESHLHLKVLKNIVLYHHESFDGTGYSGGLAGEEIPLEARVVSIADVYDALTSVRPYKDAWDPAKAVAWLREQSGKKFDPACVDAFCRRHADIEAVRLQFQTEIPPEMSRIYYH